MIAVQVALSGALIGGLYALMAAGLSVTWGVLRVINLAHFGLILVGRLPHLPDGHRLVVRSDPHGGGDRARALPRGSRRCSGPTSA